MDQPKLLDRVRATIQLLHLSSRTQEAYIYWIKKYIFFHQKRHPADLGETHIRDFLSHLAEDQHVAASTQNQALNALVFLYKKVLNLSLGNFGSFARAHRPKRLPVVLTREETNRILNAMGARRSSWQVFSMARAFAFRNVPGSD